MLTSVDHIVVAVRDLESAAGTYTRLLGRRVSWRGTHPQLGTANALFKLENTYVELLSPVADGALAEHVRARLEQHGEGPAALAFGTDDVDACVATLRDRGLSAANPTSGSGTDDLSHAKREWRSAFLPPEEARGVSIFVIEHLSPPELLAPAPLRSIEPAAVSAVDHLVIVTSDAEACRELYGDKLGLRLAFDRSFEKRGLRLLFFRLGGVTVECAAPLAMDSSPTKNERLWGISYRVPNVAAARERVAAAGFDVSEVRPGHKPGTSVCTVRNQTHGVATLLLGPA
jgi:catechol 2,3-dioxygenase-like lactoylglutathione lyase family enzyme